MSEKNNEKVIYYTNRIIPLQKRTDGLERTGEIDEEGIVTWGDWE